MAASAPNVSSDVIATGPRLQPRRRHERGRRNDRDTTDDQPLRGPHVAQQIDGVHHLLIAQGARDVAALAIGLDAAPFAEDRKVPGHVRLGRLEDVHQLADRQRTRAESVENRQDPLSGPSTTASGTSSGHRRR